MSIKPPSDIVMDVMRAASPQGVAAAARRLEGDPGAVSTGFTTVLSEAAASPPARSAASNLARPAESPRPTMSMASSGGMSKAGFQLEALLLGNFISQMLPPDSAAVMGGGQAAELWKSLMSERIAHQIAKTGKLGIAGRLFASIASPAGQAPRDV